MCIRDRSLIYGLAAVYPERRQGGRGPQTPGTKISERFLTFRSSENLFLATTRSDRAVYLERHGVVLLRLLPAAEGLRWRALLLCGRRVITRIGALFVYNVNSQCQ